MLCGEQD